MSILKVIEVIATSKDGFTEAAQNAVEEASKTVKNIRSIYIKEQKANVKGSKIVSYAVIANITFEIEH
jgi:flavin-binding protein dodecin